MYAYEFEFFESEGYTLAYPLGLGYKAGTQGTSLDEAVDMAADLLRCIVEDALVNGKELPEPSYGHEPVHGGKVMVVAVPVSLDTINAVSASEAAERLGVSRGRVSNMLRDGVLEGFRKGRDSYVTMASLKARLASTPKAGRPRKLTIA
ncbi:MAG: helix-turn-helix domain-containing protein [Coriobacteriales bacterium]|jgi:excisionase family DNA binding protein|nr:helix-turn-helix domain-containing protein [Coriobacteriales bacterium]